MPINEYTLILYSILIDFIKTLKITTKNIQQVQKAIDRAAISLTMRIHSTRFRWLRC